MLGVYSCWTLSSVRPIPTVLPSSSSVHQYITATSARRVISVWIFWSKVIGAPFWQCQSCSCPSLPCSPTAIRVCSLHIYVHSSTDDPLEATIAFQYRKERKEHDRTAREWTRKFASLDEPTLWDHGEPVIRSASSTRRKPTWLNHVVFSYLLHHF